MFLHTTRGIVNHIKATCTDADKLGNIHSLRRMKTVEKKPLLILFLLGRVVTGAIEWRKRRCLCAYSAVSPGYFFSQWRHRLRVYNAHNNMMYTLLRCRVQTYIRLSESIVTVFITILTYCAFDGKQCSDVKRTAC